jgi:four helix bundle protein
VVDRKPAEKFEDLVVWQKAHQLGLVAQMRRATVSVPANIAEGFKRKGRSDKARIMNIAQASLEELRYYFILGRDLEYLKRTDYWDDLDEVARILAAYTNSLQS